MGSASGTKLRFMGASQNVTGSCYLLDASGRRLLIDCGLYQERDLIDRNWAPFLFDPRGIDAVLLSHGHLDHCGLLPKLVKDGFRGKIYCTSATTDIAKIVLLDSAKLQAEDAGFKKKRHEREGREGPHPEVPLYTQIDVQACFPLFSTVQYGEPFKIEDGIYASFHDAGHILGASMIKIHLHDGGPGQRSILFSGDVGRKNTPILRDPSVFEEADYIITESTYGDRLHKDNATIPDDLANIVNRAYSAGGNVVIPSFAVERTQELLYYLNKLLREDKIPHLLVFLDSPMAVRVTGIFERHQYLFDKETLEMMRRGEHLCDFPGLVICRTIEESKAINNIKGTVIIIAGSGMCTGGRIKHHLINNIGRAESAILFVGFQARETLGRSIIEGERQVRILGRQWRVEAQIEKIDGFSAHADRDELTGWLSNLKSPPEHVFVTHGEPDAANGFSFWLREKKGWDVSVPSYLEEAELFCKHA
ncbi:MBL fold metallo-hydrolase [bacterium]|nr:MBL fold metallo-hydrolase [bacterium]